MFFSYWWKYETLSLHAQDKIKTIVEIVIMVMTNERGQNTHSKGERVKIPLLPNNVGKDSVNNLETIWVVTATGCFKTKI